MSSNYPPGVTGNEPQISGEWPVNEHAPFEVVPSTEEDGKWDVLWGNSEDYFFTFDTKDEANEIAFRLNDSYSLRSPEPDDHGVCRVCGDIHGMPPGYE